MRAGNARRKLGGRERKRLAENEFSGMRGAATAKFNRNSPRRYKRRRAASRLDFLRLSVKKHMYGQQRD